MNGFWNALTQTDLANVGPETALLVICLAFCIGHVIAWTYMFTHSGLSYSQMFAASLVVLPVLVSLTMLLMVNNVSIALGLFAVIAVVRFRNVLKDTRDTSFVLWAIIQGLACGTQRFGIAALAAIAISLIFFYMRFTSFGGRHRYDVVLSLQYSGGNDNVDALKGVLRRHAVRAHLASQRDLDGQNIDLSYRLLLRDPSRSRELIRELEWTPGIGRVSLYHREDESEI
jgi:hypothetical protein